MNEIDLLKEKSDQSISIIDQYSVVMNDVLNNENKIIKLLSKFLGKNFHNAFEKVKNEISLCPKLIEQINGIKNQFQKKWTHQYYNLVFTTINSLTSIENSLIKCSNGLSGINENIYLDKNTNARNDFINSIQDILYNNNKIIENTLNRLYHVKSFDSIKDIEQSVVIIGANGSGKSSFSRRTKSIFGTNVSIISAQKIFNIQRVNHILIDSVPLNSVHEFQADEKLGKDWGSQHKYSEDLNNLIKSLVADHHKHVEKYYHTSEVKRKNYPKSKLERAMKYWNEIIIHRKMKYENYNLNIYPPRGEHYEFPRLSDGEKAIFYYVSHVLLAKENSYIIVDEPENHLHIGIASKLWDTLELLREDCKFIFLTHSLDFASSRIQATKLWNKKFTPPDIWDVVLFPNDEEIPEQLLMEILGSRKKILFCEGEKSSIDYKLYSMMFPNYTVKPVGGHIEVINYTRAFNKSKEIFGNTSIGIIDGDYHSDNQKTKWIENSIYCIETQEVENLLCDERVLKAGAKQFCCEDIKVENAKVHFFNSIEKNIEYQAIDYATQKINNTIKNNLLKKSRTVDGLKQEFNETIKKLDIEKLINERKLLLEKILNDKDYDLGIRHYNSKGLVKLIGNLIVDNFDNRILKYLETDSGLLFELREKYFKIVPLD
ncbi:MAG: AAA family ATPase [Desulfobacterales bacterium]|nr:AAA family ATPase [Desulfobacterales bacterium]